MGYRNIKKQKNLFFSSNWGFWFFNVPGQRILPILQEYPYCSASSLVFERLALVSGYQSVSHVWGGDDVVVLVVDDDDSGDGGGSNEGFGQQALARGIISQ